MTFTRPTLDREHELVRIATECNFGKSAAREKAIAEALALDGSEGYIVRMVREGLSIGAKFQKRIDDNLLCSRLIDLDQFKEAGGRG